MPRTVSTAIAHFCCSQGGPRVWAADHRRAAVPAHAAPSSRCAEVGAALGCGPCASRQTSVTLSHACSALLEPGSAGDSLRRLGFAELVQQLQAAADAHSGDSGVGAPARYRLLHCAAACGAAGAVQLLLPLLPEGAMAPDSRGYLPLHRATEHPAVMSTLLAAAPAAAMVAADGGRLALHMAASHGDTAATEVLLAAAPAAAMVDAEGMLPL